MIKFHKVKKVYEPHNVVLDNINLEIKPGEFVCLVGLSGAGKSTLLKMLTREERSTSGEVIVEGNIGNPIAVDLQVDAALIAAGRVVTVRDAIGRRQLPPVARALVVVEDDLLVELGEIGGHLEGGQCRMPNAEWQTGSASVVVKRGLHSGERADNSNGVLVICCRLSGKA